MADSKILSFSTLPILNIFFQKFHGLVLGLVGLIDLKGIELAQPIWPWGCPTYAPKQAKNAFFVFLGNSWAYVGQPHGHISWATPKTIKSIWFQAKILVLKNIFFTINFVVWLLEWNLWFNIIKYLYFFELTHFRG